jgi:hypothetical protein
VADTQTKHGAWLYLKRAIVVDAIRRLVSSSFVVSSFLPSPPSDTLRRVVVYEWEGEMTRISRFFFDPRKLFGRSPLVLLLLFVFAFFF